VINGPGFLREPIGRQSPTWGPLRTGTYGPLENGLYRLEPDWYLGLASPTLSGPRPAFGSRIDDNGVVWRVEAPNLYAFGPASGPTAGPRPMQAVLVESRNSNDLLGVLAPGNLVSAGAGQDRNVWNFNPDLSQLQPNFFFGDQFTPILSSPFRQNVSEFQVRTSKTAGPATGPVETRGRFGSLVAGARTDVGFNANILVRPWTDGIRSVNRRSDIGATETIPAAESPWRTDQIGQYHMAGFHGSIPAALSPPGHPAWATITIGVVGGFSNRVDASHLDTRLRDAQGIPQGPFTSPAAIERRWTLGSGLR
jgi:hypothetical protein